MYKVTDKVYKVVYNSIAGRHEIMNFQILRIMRHGRLICFAVGGGDFKKAQWSFSQEEVSATPQEAIARKEKELLGSIDYLHKKTEILQKEYEEVYKLQIPTEQPSDLSEK